MLQANSVIENTPDNLDIDLSKMDQIKSNLNEIKISVEDVNQKLNNLDKNKKNLDQQKIIEEQKNIDEKKLEIEKKKKETELLINQLRELANLEKDVSVTANIKNELDQYEKQLKDINTQNPGFWLRLKESSNNAIGWVRENPWQAAGVATGVVLLAWGISSLFRKRKEKKESKDGEDKEKTPRYKRWYTWAGVGLAGFLGWRYRGDIKNFWNILFNGEKDQKDKFGKELVESLGKDRSYDSAGNIFIYKSKKYTRENFYEKQLIHTKMDVNGKLILDLDKSVLAIRGYVDNDKTTLPGKHDIVDFDKYRQEWLSLQQTEKVKYTNLDNQIESFYNKFHSNDFLKFSSEKYGFDKGFFLFHMDEHFGNIGTLLNKQTFSLFMDASTESMVESIFKYFPNFIIDSFLGLAKGMNIVGLEQFAQDTSRLGDRLKTLKPTEVSKLEDLCLFFFNQSTAVSYYALAVRDAYAEKVGGDVDKINEFEKQKLKDLDLFLISDPNIKSAVEEPQIDKDISKRIDKWDGDQKKLSDELDKAKTIQEKKKVVERLIDEIDDVGYHTWNSALAFIWGHVFEKSSYVEYDIISQMHKGYFGDMRLKLKELLNKDSLNDADVIEIKNHIKDFYDTMKMISTQVELRQETDENSNLFTVLNFPLVRGGKTIFETFMLYKEEGKWVLAGGTVAAGLLAGDILTWPVRKVLAMRKLFAFKSPIVRLSPTDFVVRKISSGTLSLLGYSAQKGGEMISRNPTRIISQRLNHSKFYRSINYRTPESLFEALNRGHITLNDAATMLAGKSSGKTFSGVSSQRIWGNKWRELGFGNDIGKNMKNLLQHNKWVKNNIGMYTASNADAYDILIKNRDTKKVRVARLRSYSGDRLTSLLSELSKGNLSDVVDATTRSARNLSNVDKIGISSNKLSSDILNSKNSVEKITKSVFESFEKELASEAGKKGLKVGSKEYKKLSESIRNMPDYNPKLQQSILVHNDIVAKAEEKLIRNFNKASWSQKQYLYANDDVVKRIVNANGGIEKWRIPGFGRTGRLISVGIHAVMLGWISSSPDENGNEKDWGTIGGEAADFGLGMIPVAGGIYDIGMAFRGSDLNGRQMGTTERWIRGGVGLGTGALDLFTFGLGGTAIRASLKGGTKLALKTGSRAVATETVKVASKGVGTGVAKQIFKSSVRNIIVGTAAGIALIPVAGGIREIFIDDGADEEAKEDKDMLDNSVDVLDNSTIE